MVRPLTFKGDKPKKRKHREDSDSRRIKSEYASSTTTTDTIARAGAAEDETPEETSWVSADVPSDIGGPVIIVLPSSPPTCIACDANGKVYASELENMIESDPATAEPHDVRQVWVATKVAGTEGISFKGHHGR
jgi:protein FRG1